MSEAAITQVKDANPRSKWKRRLLIGLGLIAVVVWFLPTLVAKTPALGWLVQRAAKDVNGSVSVGGASLGWFSPVRLRDVSMRDAAGEPLLFLPQVESERRLLELLVNPSELGQFRCDKAAVEIVFTKEATNFEKALAHFLTAEAEPGKQEPGGHQSAHPLQLTVDCAAATVTVTDLDSKGKWILNPVNVHLGLNEAGGPPLRLQLQAAVAGASPGFVQTELELDAQGENTTRLKGKMDKFPSALANLMLRRHNKDNLLDGNLRGQWNVAWKVAEPLAIEGDAALGWDNFTAYGCDIGPLDFKARLGDGWLRLAPSETTLNGGRLRLSADVHINRQPPEVHLPRGMVVENAQITPAMCAGALRYAVPALAGITEVQGMVSLSLDGGQINPTALDKSEVRGTFTLHSAKIGPGSLVRELSDMFGSAPATFLKETRVPFQLANGRVNHQNFEMAFPDFTLRTSGSVGLDGTIALVVEVPVPPKWLGNNPLAATLAKQTIRLPIGGTIDRPQLERGALQAASSQFLKGAAKDALRQGIDQKLKKLLGGR